jgi:hypothetical protein
MNMEQLAALRPDIRELIERYMAGGDEALLDEARSLDGSAEVLTAIKDARSFRWQVDAAEEFDASPCSGVAPTAPVMSAHAKELARRKAVQDGRGKAADAAKVAGATA